MSVSNNNTDEYISYIQAMEETLDKKLNNIMYVTLSYFNRYTVIGRLVTT